MSDKDSWNDPFESPQPAAPKKRMSGCMIAFLVILGLGVLGLIVCGGLAAYVASNFKMKQTEDPKEISEISNQILTMTIPEGFTATEGAAIDFIVGSMKIATYEYESKKGGIVLGVIQINIKGANNGDMRKEFDKRAEGDVVVKETKVRDITIDGKPAKMTIGEGTMKDTDEPAHTANVLLGEAEKQYFIAIEMLDEIWDEDAIVKMLEEAKIP